MRDGREGGCLAKETMKLNFTFCIFRSAFCIVLLLTGCARFKPAMKGEQEEQPKGIEIHTQYAVSSDQKLGYNTFEVYIANHTDNTITFTGAELNGKPLPVVPSDKLRKLLTVKLGEGDEITLTEPGFPEDSPVTWWQYYPCNEVKPGKTIEFQVNFKAIPTGRQELRLTRQGDEPIGVTVPRFRQPEKRLTAITYSLDGKRMFVQYASGKIGIKKLQVNGKTISELKTIKSLGGDTPDLVAFDAPFKLHNGNVLHVSSEFQDNSRCDALVRVLLGIALDGGFKEGSNEKAIRKEYGLDEYSVVEMLPFDVTCGDTKAGKNGMSAPTVTETRTELYRQKQDRLAGLGYCTAMYPGLFNIYGQIADTVFAKPYRLNWGHIPSRFIEEEEECIAKTQKTSEPKPFLWIPERFRKGRRLEAGEFQMLSWMALANGSKGIRYHFWKNDSNNPFADCHELGEEIKRLNMDIRLKAEELSPLVLVRAWVDEKQKAKIYENWSGDKGIMMVVRNLDYVTDKNENQSGQAPRFHIKSRENVKVEFSLPTGMRLSTPKDLLSGDLVKSSAADGKMTFILRRLDTVSVVWFQAER